MRYKLLISLLFLGYGLALIGQPLLYSFTPVPATVIESSRVALPHTSAYRSTRYRYTFTYEYTYLEQQYTSNRYSYFDRNNSSNVCNHPTGNVITVYVNKRNPAHAVINPQVSAAIYVIVGIGSLMVIHSIMDYVPGLAHTPWLQTIYVRLGTVIGITLFFGLLAYLGYNLFLAAIQNCVNPMY